MEGHELQRAIAAFGNDELALYFLFCVNITGYNLTPQAMGCLLRRYSSNNKITFDDFVSCVTKLRSLTSKYCCNISYNVTKLM